MEACFQFLLDEVMLPAIVGCAVARIDRWHHQRTRPNPASCEHAFVTTQGTPLTRYRRAIDAQSLILAELAAREVGTLALEDALGLVLLYGAANDPRFPRAARRWLGRLALERDVGLPDLAGIAVALASAPYDPHGCRGTIERLMGR